MTNKPSSGQIAAIGVELLLFTVISFYGIKWLAKILDPTSKQKESAKKQVSFHVSHLATQLFIFSAIIQGFVSFF